METLIRGNEVKNEITGHSLGLLFLFSYSILVFKSAGNLAHILGTRPPFHIQFRHLGGGKKDHRRYPRRHLLCDTLKQEIVVHRYRVLRDGNSCFLFDSRFEDFEIDTSTMRFFLFGRLFFFASLFYCIERR